MSEKEYIFVGNAQLKTRDYIEQLQNELKEYKKKDKTIKDLKERNNTLKNQYELKEIRVNVLEHREIEKDKEIEKLHSIIKEVREILLNYGETFDLKVHQEMQKELLEILDKVEEK